MVMMVITITYFIFKINIIIIILIKISVNLWAESVGDFTLGFTLEVVLEVYDKYHVIMMIVIANMNDQGGDEPLNLENKGGVVI